MVRERLIERGLQSLDSGASISLTGERGSGRSTVARRIADRASTRGWSVLRVRGLAAFQETPLLALSLGGVKAAQQARASAMPSVVEEMVKQLPSPRSLIVVDDWEFLDDASRGAVDFLRLETLISLVAVRPCGFSDASTGPAPSATSDLIELRVAPLTYDELGRLMRSVLDGHTDQATLARIFAKSGGLAGIAVAIARCARREGGIERRDGVWSATRSLWSPSLNAQLEAMIAPLSSSQRELLGRIAIGDVDSVDRLETGGARAELEALTRQGLVTLVPTGSRVVVSIRPPILAEYFLHDPSVPRRLRLGGPSPDAGAQRSPAPPMAVVAERGDEQTPQLTRLIQERLRAQLEAAGADWEARKDLPAFVNYVDALMRSGVDAGAVDEAFAAASGISGDESSEIRRHCLFADHIAYARHEPQRAIAHLVAMSQSFGQWGHVLSAHAAELEAECGDVPEAASLPVVPMDPVPDAVRIALHRAHALVHLVRGELREAGPHVRALGDLSEHRLDHRAVLVSGTYRVMSGDFDGAADYASRGIREARSRLDPIGIRSFGMIKGMASVAQGKYDRLDRVLNDMLPLGIPSAGPLNAELVFLTQKAVAASRRGDDQAARLCVIDAERLGVRESGFPVASAGIIQAFAAAAEGRVDEAVAIALGVGDTLWRRNARLSAACAYLFAIEFSPDRATLGARRARIELIEDGILPQELAYLDALVLGAADAVLGAAEDLEQAGRIGLALNGYRAALRLSARAKVEKTASAAQLRISELRGTLPPDSFEPERGIPGDSRLSEREREIAKRAGSGETNKQIAASLVLSVRTVETHLRRAMQKTGVAKRSQFAEYFGA